MGTVSFIRQASGLWTGDRVESPLEHRGFFCRQIRSILLTFPPFSVTVKAEEFSAGAVAQARRDGRRGSSARARRSNDFGVAPQEREVHPEGRIGEVGTRFANGCARTRAVNRYAGFAARFRRSRTRFGHCHPRETMLILISWSEKVHTAR